MLAVLAVAGLAGCSHHPPQADAPTATTGGPGAVTRVAPTTAVKGGPTTSGSGPHLLYGVTIDDVNEVSSEAAALARLPDRATVRVYFDAAEPPSYYLPAVQRLHEVAAVMGELLDSSDETALPVGSMAGRTRAYLAELGPYVDIWEVGNEVNGNFTGPYVDVASRLDAAYNVVSAAGRPTALTFYANEFGPDHCGDGSSELTPVQFAEHYVPATVARHLDYVFLSYYPTQCGGVEPGSAVVGAEMAALHRIFPAASVGFGEIGLPEPTSGHNRAEAAQIMSWAYALDPHLPYYVGGYFWWYGAEDALGSGAILSGDLASAFARERAALG